MKRRIAEFADRGSRCLRRSPTITLSAVAAERRRPRPVLLAHASIETPEKIQGRKLSIVARHDTGSGNVPRLPAIRVQFMRAADPRELVVLDGAAHAQFIFQTDEGKRLMREILRFLTAP